MKALSEYETSPFFATSWDSTDIKKLCIISCSIYVAFSFVSLTYLDSSVSYQMNHHGDSFSVTVLNIPFLSHPARVYLSPIPSNISRLSIKTEKGVVSQHIKAELFRNGLLYEIWSLPNNSALSVKAPPESNATITMWTPSAGGAIFASKLVSILFSSSVLALSFGLPSLSSALPCAAFSFGVCLSRISILSRFLEALILNVCAGLYLFIGFRQAQLLTVNSRLLRICTSVFPIVTAVMCLFSSSYIELCSFALISLSATVSLSLLLLALNRSAMDPTLLFLHFLSVVMPVATALLFSVLRSASVWFRSAFFSEVFDVFVVSFFLCFVTLFVIGDLKFSEIRPMSLFGQQK